MPKGPFWLHPDQEELTREREVRDKAMAEMTERQHAARRLREAKDRMDYAQLVLDKAEDDWYQARQEFDRIDAEQYRKAVDGVNRMNDKGEIPNV